MTTVCLEIGSILTSHLTVHTIHASTQTTRKRYAGNYTELKVLTKSALDKLMLRRQGKLAVPQRTYVAFDELSAYRSASHKAMKKANPIGKNCDVLKANFQKRDRYRTLHHWLLAPQKII